MLKNLLFDLDGTLLGMPSQDEFVKIYYGSLKHQLEHDGLDSKKIMDSLNYGVYGMFKNNGKASNEDIFWNTFFKHYGNYDKNINSVFERFYETCFDLSKKSTYSYDGLNDCLKSAKEKGYNLILATNPIFPLIATKKRIEWAGLDYNLFSYITTYENSTFCKPNPKYFQEILDNKNLSIKETMMFGNDTVEDLSISSLGVDTYIVTDCLINKNASFVSTHQGTMKEMMDYVCNLPVIEND